MVTVAVGRESAPGERRVGLVPDSVAKLVKEGITVRVLQGAGEGAMISDGAYAAAGATISPTFPELLEGADVLIRVRRPSAEEAGQIPSGVTLIALLQPGAAGGIGPILEERGVIGLALEKVPRITRAQSMDVLSSQSTVSGYKAVILGASAITKFLPMLTTAAGAIPPARVFVIGAGVAGLQAIATAKRLGAIVSAFDVRAAAAEQIRSLGATFVSAAAPPADAETAGGYAKEQSDDERERTLAAIAKHIPTVDLVIATAQIPGRPAPRLITAEMVASMQPGSAIVDLAAETGGNCDQTCLGDTIIVGGVTIIGPRDLAATLPLHASQMFSRNIVTILQHVVREGILVIEPDDEIVGPMFLTPPVAAAPS